MFSVLLYVQHMVNCSKLLHFIIDIYRYFIFFILFIFKNVYKVQYEPCVQYTLYWICTNQRWLCKASVLVHIPRTKLHLKLICSKITCGQTDMTTLWCLDIHIHSDIPLVINISEESISWISLSERVHSMSLWNAGKCLQCSNTEEYNLNFHPVLNPKSHPILCSFYASLKRIYKSGHDKHGLWNDRLEMEGVSEEQTVMIFPSVPPYWK
jgi:hypothetical protein